MYAPAQKTPPEQPAIAYNTSKKRRRTDGLVAVRTNDLVPAHAEAEAASTAPDDEAAVDFVQGVEGDEVADEERQQL